MDKEQYTVYEHINLKNNKRYIGITKQDPVKRWANGRGYIKNQEFFNDILLYGWKEGFKHNILYQNLTESEAYQKEIELIQKYDLTNPEKGYNKSKGGATGPGDFTKMTEWARNHKKFGQDNARSKRVKCIETNDVFGSISEAERWCNTDKVSECCQGKRQHAGRHPETGELLTWRFVDNTTPVTIICNEPLKEKKHIKKVKCTDTGMIFNSASEAGRYYNIAACNILRVCNHTRKTAGKKKWEYIDEEGDSEI